MGNKLSSTKSSATNLSIAHERFTTPKLTDSSELVRKPQKRLIHPMRLDKTFNCIKNGDKLKVCMKYNSLL